MAAADASEGLLARPAVRRALLIGPALAIIGAFMLLPLGLMAYVSLLERGLHGGVEWHSFTPEAYVKFLFERDLMGNLEVNTDYLQIDRKSVV